MSKGKLQEMRRFSRVVVAILVIGFAIIAKNCPDPEFRPKPRRKRCDKCKSDDHKNCQYNYWFYDGDGYCMCCGIRDW